MSHFYNCDTNASPCVVVIAAHRNRRLASSACGGGGVAVDHPGDIGSASERAEFDYTVAVVTAVGTTGPTVGRWSAMFIIVFKVYIGLYTLIVSV